MLWGFCEALDLFEIYKKNEEIAGKTEVNILLFGSGDPRHIIKTWAKSYKHSVKVNFFILEGCPALIARQMVLLSIALESDDLLTLSAKTYLFMDIYGNSLLRSSSVGYLSSKANQLIKCVTDLDFNAKMQSMIDLSHLKFAERDSLENTFQFWREKKTNHFDISNHWMQRIRQMLRERYDSRLGIYDWDHQMRLKDNGAQQICSQEYKHWRETGIAFTFPEYRQSHANKTFAVQSSASGYVGDITVGPFCAFGLSSTEPRLLKSQHGQNEYRATDITECNLFEMFHEIQERKSIEGEVFAMHKLGMAKIDTGKLLDSNGSPHIESELKQFNKPLISTDQIRITFLSVSEAQLMINGTKYHSFFDVVFVGRNYLPILKKNFANMIVSNGVVLFETAQLSVKRKPEIADFLTTIRNTAKQMQLKAVSKFNINLPLPIVTFIKTESLSENE